MNQHRPPRDSRWEQMHAWAQSRRDKTHSRWPRGSSRHRFFFLRLLVVFGFLALLLVGGVSLLAFLVSRLLPGGDETPTTVWIAALLLIALLLMVGSHQGTRAYRGVARPLADVIDAADAVAQGKLDARVPEESPGDFGRLARTFNRMVRELELSDQRRRNLMADVAHELRTPLHILQGNLEGLLDGVYQPTDEQIAAMLGETRRLARLVEDLRTLSLAETGQLTLHKEPVQVGELLGDLGTSFDGMAEAAGITFRVDCPDETSQLTLVADIGRLHQVFGNLISNAIRHTPAGGTVGLSALSPQSSVLITVSDPGPGISPEDLPRVFDRYWRADQGGSGSGSGLGLAIARQLVELHGGRISVESNPPGGTTFTVELPVATELPTA